MPSLERESTCNRTWIGILSQTQNRDFVTLDEGHVYDRPRENIFDAYHTDRKYFSSHIGGNILDAERNGLQNLYISNVRSQIMTHHQFMGKFRDCLIKCV